MQLFNIRGKLFSLVFCASLALIAVIYWQIGEKAKTVSQEVIDRSLVQSSQILQTRIESRFAFITEIGKGLATDGRIRPLVYEQASATLQDLSIEYQASYDFTSLFFLSAQGTILARSDQPNAIGANVAGRTSLFDNALSGQRAQGFFASQGKLMQTVVTPIFDNVATDLVKGAVVLAYELSPATATEIYALTQSHIGFYTFTRDQQRQVIGAEASYVTDLSVARQLTQHFANEPTYWQRMTEPNSGVVNDKIVINGNLYQSLLKPITNADGIPLGFVIALRANADLTQPFDEIRQQLLIDGGISLLIASVFAALMAMGISRPILRLVDLVRLIQSGDYPDDSHKSTSRDEVGILQNAIVKMGQNLKEKAELEAYLAKFADEIEQDALLPSDHDLIGTDATIIQLTPEQAQQDTSIVGNRFELLSELGSGTMGKVYLARDLELDDKLAIKIIDKTLFENIEGYDFREEIRLARKITHKNIVRTFDYGSVDDKIYITMEYVAGFDLGQLLSRQGALDLPIGLAICKQICLAMMSAHQMGIIHRDLKPANMLINRQGILKIMDFGLAMQRNESLANSVDAQDNTASSAYMMGTPRFMAPEQFSVQGEIDERTDVYSIGVIMYTIFSGHPPFLGKSLKALAYQHLNADIPSLDNPSGQLPATLNDIVRKALAKQPEARFQSATAIYDALGQIAI